MAAMDMLSRALLVLLLAGPAAYAQQTVIGIIGDWGMGPDGIIKTSSFAHYGQQIAVAKALGDTCQSLGCHLVLGLGDNFYDAGISHVLGPQDPQWQTSWANIYNHSYLQNLTFWHSIGNHDYGYPVALDYGNDTWTANGFNASTLNPAVYGNFKDQYGNLWTANLTKHFNFSITPQIEYTWSDPQGRWKLPGRYYNQVFKNLPVPFGLTVVDTNPYFFTYCCDMNSSVSNFSTTYDINDNQVKGVPSGNQNARPCDANNDPKYNTTELKYACQNNQRDAQAKWAKKSLQNTNALGYWNILVNHHPMINIGDGLSNPWSFFAQDIMNAPGAKPHFSLNGHEHVLAMNLNNMVNQTVFASIGSSGNCQNSLNDPTKGAWATSGLYNPGAGPFGSSDTLRTTVTKNLGVWNFQAAYSGFGIITLNTTHATIDFWGALLPATPASAFTPSSSFTKLYSYTLPKF